MCTNPHCFEDCCQGECMNRSEIVESPEGKKVRLDNLKEPDIEPTPLRSKYIYCECRDI